jgi:hypothetical protein
MPAPHSVRQHMYENPNHDKLPPLLIQYRSQLLSPCQRVSLRVTKNKLVPVTKTASPFLGRGFPNSSIRRSNHAVMTVITVITSHDSNIGGRGGE